MVNGEAGVYEGTVSLRLRDDRSQVASGPGLPPPPRRPGGGSSRGRSSCPAGRPRLDPGAFEVGTEDGQIGYSVQLPVWVGR